MTDKPNPHERVQALMRVAVSHVQTDYPDWPVEARATFIAAYMQAFATAAGSFPRSSQ